MILRLRSCLPFLPVFALLAGCSTATQKSPVAQPGFTSGLHGSLHGGQQPVVGAIIQLYQVGATGDGSASSSILNAPYNTTGIPTGSDGGFDLTGKFNCPTSTTLVYLVATGGNPGFPPPFNNPNSLFLSALGQCGNPNNITFLNVSEVTTVAAVYALAPFMTSPTAIGSGPSDTQALASAFTLAWEFADPTTGLSPGSNVPSGTTIPTAQINTLANLISACVNSAGGVATDTSTICGQIFSLTQGSGTAPTDTATALLHLALNPSLNTAALYNLVLPTAPFQPTITQQPPDFGVRPTVPSNFTVSPSSLDFGSMFINGVTAPQLVTIANNSAHGVLINSFQVYGADPNDFALSNGPADAQATPCETISVYEPGESCTQLQIIFKPTATGPRHAYLVVGNTSPNPFIAIPLSGTGTPNAAGPVTVAPTSLNMTLYNTPQPVVLTNNGTSALSISGFQFKNAAYGYSVSTYSETDNCGYSVAASASCSIYVTAHPDSSSAIMTIADDAAAGPQTVALNFTQPGFLTLDSLDFGVESVGTQGVVNLPVATSNLTPANSSTTLTLSGTNASDFSFSPSTHTITSNCAYYNGSTGCSIPLYFNPSALGLRTATISLSGSGNVPITGTGVGGGPYFVATPIEQVNRKGGFNFGNLSIGGQFGNATATEHFTVRYTGTVAGAVNAPVVTGSNASDFTSTSNCQNGTVGGTCTLTLTYTPSSPSVQGGSALIADVTNTVQQTIPFVATVVGPGTTASPTQLTFASTLAGTLSAPQSTTITAETNNPVQATITGPFQISQNPACSATPCQISVVFAPSASASAGVANGRLNITDSYTGKATIVYLSGTTATQTTASVSPGSLTFPLQTVNTTSSPQSVAVNNIGATNGLSFSSVTVTGANPGDFLLANGCNTTVAPGSQCNIIVSFRPGGSGPRAATLNIVSNSTTSTDTVSLSGTAQ